MFWIGLLGKLVRLFKLEDNKEKEGFLFLFCLVFLVFGFFFFFEKEE